MDCRDCARHNAETGKCLDGKINPRRYEHVLSAAQVFGLRAICVFNDHRERLVGVHQLDVKSDLKAKPDPPLRPLP